MAQLEDFQKKLWLKKKFVLQSDYCITLDRMDETFYPTIAANDRQRGEWVELYAIDDLDDYAEPLTAAFLKDHPFLMVDTQFFNRDWKYKLLATFDDLDDSTNGLMINSENFQALRFLKQKYQNKIDLVYLDPPYNTEKDRTEGKFLYKDSYEHSSWLSLMINRYNESKILLNEKSVILESLDENEYSNQVEALDYWDHLGTIVLQTATDNNPTQVNTEHEYILCFAVDKSEQDYWYGKNEGAELIQNKYLELKKEHGHDLEEIQTILRKWIRKNEDKLPRVTHYNNVDEHGVFHDADVANTRFGGYKYEVIHPVTGAPCKIPDKGFRFPKETMMGMIENDQIMFGDDETTLIKPKKRVENAKSLLRSIIYEDGRSSTKRFENMFHRGAFPNPKSEVVLKRLFLFPTNNDSIILDFFAGSGTTGHAVINLNREDAGNRKYIMVEMGEYFNSVTKPRIQKVVYSKDWKDGKPVGREGLSHMFKYLRLESYEDTLNNLNLQRSGGQQELLENEELNEEYLLHYMLDVEARDSLLTTETFIKPFSYTIAATEHNERNETEVDMVETFNYLIGLNVQKITLSQGYVAVVGQNNDGEQILVIWRDLEKHDNEALEKFFRSVELPIEKKKLDLIYVNGDHNLQTIRKQGEGWKVKLIEKEFHQRMFEQKGL